MILENIKHVRDNVFRAVHKNKAVEFRLDNNFIVKERSQFVGYDEEHELIYAVERNIDVHRGRDCPFKIIVQDVDQVQDMSCQVSDEEIVPVLKATGAFTDDQIKNIVDKLTFTLEDYADSTGNHFKGRRSVIADV